MVNPSCNSVVGRGSFGKGENVNALSIVVMKMKMITTATDSPGHRLGPWKNYKNYFVDSKFFC